MATDLIFIDCVLKFYVQLIHAVENIQRQPVADILSHAFLRRRYGGLSDS